MQVAIPSHNRIENLIKCIEMYSLVWEITVFVQDKEYHAEVSQRVTGCSIVMCPPFVSMSVLRNQVLDHYKEGEEVLFIDDDVTKIYIRDTKRSTQMTGESIAHFVSSAFSLCRKRWVKHWWISPYYNFPIRMLNSIRANQFVVWCFFGVIKSSHRFDEEIFAKEDYDFSLTNIIHWTGNIRFEYISCNNVIWVTSWWLQERKQRAKKDRENVIYLIKKRWDLVRMKSNNPWQLSLNQSKIRQLR